MVIFAEIALYIISEYETGIKPIRGLFAESGNRRIEVVCHFGDDRRSPHP